MRVPDSPGSDLHHSILAMLVRPVFFVKRVNNQTDGTQAQSKDKSRKHREYLLVVDIKIPVSENDSDFKFFLSQGALSFFFGTTLPTIGNRAMKPLL